MPDPLDIAAIEERRGNGTVHYHRCRWNYGESCTCRATEDFALLLAEVKERRAEAAELRDELGQRTRAYDRVCREYNALSDKVTESLATPEHHHKMLAGMPFCECGHSLRGDEGRAPEVLIEHLLSLAAGHVATIGRQAAVIEGVRELVERAHVMAGVCRVVPPWWATDLRKILAALAVAPEPTKEGE